jgi:hypothetical protein
MSVHLWDAPIAGTPPEPLLLKAVTVRLIEDSERQRFDEELAPALVDPQSPPPPPACPVRTDRLDSLGDRFGQEMTDPRDPRGVRHKLAALLTLPGLASAWSSNWPCPPTPTKRQPSPPICPTWIWRESA